MSQSSKSGEDSGGGVLEVANAGWSARTKKRARRFSSSERARHRVIEKERREAFNTCLLELASLLPALDDTKQSLLSKHIIVQESIKQHKTHKTVTVDAEQKLLAVAAERDELVRQLQQQQIRHQAQIASLLNHSAYQHSGDPQLPSRQVQAVIGDLQHEDLTYQPTINGTAYNGHTLTEEQSLLLPNLPFVILPAETSTAAVGPIYGGEEYENTVDLDFYLQRAMQEYLPYSIPPA